jgi:small subunit ribosomal protein S8
MTAFCLLLSRLNRGFMCGKRVIFVGHSNFAISVLDLLYREGLLAGFEVTASGNIKVFPKFYGKRGAISKLLRVSLPSKKVYMSSEMLDKVYGTGEVVVVSSSRGLFLYQRGQVVSYGGEVLFRVL